MTSPMSDTPIKEAEVANPGSAAAIRLGCTCPVIDNHHGRGVPMGKDGAPLFWHSEKCPLHGSARAALAEEARP